MMPWAAYHVMAPGSKAVVVGLVLSDSTSEYASREWSFIGTWTYSQSMPRGRRRRSPCMRWSTQLTRPSFLDV